MTNKNTKAKRGFTIIEVVLVLAIAGLIFLMVFVALPTLQRNQRDTARKNDLDRFQSSLISYVSSNNKLPVAISGADASLGRIYTRQCDSGEVTDTNECYDFATYKSSDTQNTWAKFVGNYLLADGDTFQDQNGDAYSIYRVDYSASDHGGMTVGEGFTAEDFGDGSLLEKFTGAIMVAIGASCNKDDDKPFVIKDSDGRRSFAVALKLEAGSVYCLEN